MEKSSRAGGEGDMAISIRRISLKLLGARVFIALVILGVAQSLDIKKTLEDSKETVSRLLCIENKTDAERIVCAESNKIDVSELGGNATLSEAEESGEEKKAETEKKLAICKSSLEKADELLRRQEYLSALNYFNIAQGEYILSGVSDESSSILKEIQDGKYKTLLKLGRFEEIIDELRSSVDEDDVKLVQKVSGYIALNINSPEDELNHALLECPHSSTLLVLRIEQRIRHKIYNLALLDAEALSEIDGQKERGELLMMQCYFLMGKSGKGLSILETMSHLTTLYEKASFIMQKYSNLNKNNYRSTQHNYMVWKNFVDRDLVLAKLIDSRFVPTIFTYTKIQGLEVLVRMGVELKHPTEQILAHSKQILVEGSKGAIKTQDDWKRHIILMINLGSFSDAFDIIKINMTEGTPAYDEVKELYNQKIKIAREKKAKIDEIKRKRRKRLTRKQ